MLQSAGVRQETEWLLLAEVVSDGSVELREGREVGGSGMDKEVFPVDANIPISFLGLFLSCHVFHWEGLS